MDRGYYRQSKAICEAVFSLLLLVLLAPLILVLIVMVRLTSPGPGIYAQVRVGYRGRLFTIYKIRTMRRDCERDTGPTWSTVGDMRVTPLGRWLRRLHLDELPQLYNVLRGDMSLIGPRPERPEFVEQLQTVIPDYRARLLVRPGITGLAQIQLPPDEDITGVRRKVCCDAVYVSSMGLWLDLRILAGTLLKIAGLPFEVIRRVLCLPGLAVRPVGAGAAVESEGLVAAQMQTA